MKKRAKWVVALLVIPLIMVLGANPSLAMVAEHLIH